MSNQFSKSQFPSPPLEGTDLTSLKPREGEGSLSPPVVRLTHGIDYSVLRSLISMTDVLKVLGWQPVARHGPQLRGPCPIHKSTSLQSRSLSVHLDRHVFQCFACGEKGNQLDLYVAATGLPVFQAARVLAARLGVEFMQIEKRNS